MTHGSLFSGIGGFDLAAEWMGWENLFHCEWNPFGQKVLHHYWPNAQQFTDITKTDFTPYANRISVLTGGFPCQPYSTAGKRLGKADERHLWPHMLRAIKEIQPRWVVGENVLGLVNWSGGLVFHEVQADLEAAGYEVWPYVLNAASVNAPHRRDRVWFVAYAKDKGEREQRSYNSGRNTDEFKSHNGYKVRDSVRSINEVGDATNSNGTEPGTNIGTDIGTEGEIRRRNKGDVLGGFSELGDATNTDSANNKTRPFRKVLGQSDRQKTNGFIDVECTNQWSNFPTQPPICTRNDGFSARLDGITFSKWRNESIKAAGNAIVPQVVFQIFKTISDYDRQTSSPPINK